jgi:hypothetical protein
MVVITVYPQCNFNILNVILQLFKIFIVIVIQFFKKIIAIADSTTPCYYDIF